MKELRDLKPSWLREEIRKEINEKIARFNRFMKAVDVIERAGLYRKLSKEDTKKFCQLANFKFPKVQV